MLLKEAARTNVHPLPCPGRDWPRSEVAKTFIDEIRQYFVYNHDIYFNFFDRPVSLSSSFIRVHYSVYIGKTTRNVNIRIKEHLRCLKSNGFSEFANHLIEKDHTFSKSTGAKILHKNGHGNRLNNLEALEIKKAIKTNSVILNNQLNLSTSPILGIFPVNT